MMILALVLRHRTGTDLARCGILVRCVFSVAVLLAVNSARHPAEAQQIAINPQVHSMHQRGVLDWPKLFTDDPEWSALASHFQVYLAPAGLVLETPDARLRAIAADLRRRHIAFELGLNAIGADPGDPCGGREGYAPPIESRIAVQKMQRLGIKVDILAMDGPVLIGHDSPDRPTCRLPIADVVQRVARNLRDYLDAYPDLVIGDIEGVPGLMTYPGWQSDYRVFKQQLEAAIGRKIAFFRTDVNWRSPGWAESLRTVQSFAHDLGMKFSVIYDGDGLDGSDEAWVADARDHFSYLESAGGVIPDEASFESWNLYPNYVLPMSADTAFGSLVAGYTLPRTHFVVTRSSNSVAGQLVDAAKQPVADAAITVMVLGMDPTRPPPVRTATGLVPDGAHFAILGLRINSECLCTGPNDLVFGDFIYAETTGPAPVRQTYSYLQQARHSPARRADGTILHIEVIDGREFVHIIAAPDQSFGFNSPQFAVTPGAHFEFSVPIGSLNDLGLFGGATVIWLTADGAGVGRTNLRLGADPMPAGTASTDAGGRFRVALPTNPLGPQRPVRLYYLGNASLRAAYSNLP